MDCEVNDDDLYGTCTLVPCKCLRTEWLGTLCPNWKPASKIADTTEGVRDELEKITQEHGKTH